MAEVVYDSCALQTPNGSIRIRDPFAYEFYDSNDNNDNNNNNNNTITVIIIINVATSCDVKLKSTFGDFDADRVSPDSTPRRCVVDRRRALQLGRP